MYGNSNWPEWMVQRNRTERRSTHFLRSVCVVCVNVGDDFIVIQVLEPHICEIVCPALA